ncbi:hypothetical protein LG943_00675 [Streptomonospora sp. S1-112]|uniref:Uncharacterized protein n=1 Tax=Streptomonospora mangrovi TaxID=2883123 RepID=A0A9X3SBT5_9ACTN|nr:hypothetical protein [Streptomonospora mangrovi]MDA0562858.1 hypothetical protein [Streptomonospora mangrovi]
MAADTTTATTTTALHRIADRTAWLLASPEPEDVQAGLRLAWACPPEARPLILEAVAEFMPEDQEDTDA